MTVSFIRVSTLVCAVSFLGLSSCGTPPTLNSKAAAVPAGIDMTGNWVVRRAERVSRPQSTEESIVVLSRTRGTKRAQRSRDSSGVSAQVFLEFGNKLKITQTDYSLFISYDRSIVEEYTFGENRLVSIGPIEALRVSGWDTDSFVVETLDDSGTTLFETWRLQEGGSVLVRDIRISKGENESFVNQEIFDRN